MKGKLIYHLAGPQAFHDILVEPTILTDRDHKLRKLSKMTEVPCSAGR